VVSSGSLLLGGLAALWRPVNRILLGLIMAFGAGVLMSAVAFELVEEGIDQTGRLRDVALGLALGSLTFFAGDWLIDRRGGDNRKRSGGQQSGGSASAIVIGALMDGIPESAAIGLTLIEGGGVGVAVVAAVFLSNMPESISAAVGLRRAGRRPSRILAMWMAVALVSGLAAALGYGLLDSASPALVGAVQAFAAGAILTMLADTMMPEAFEHGGGVVGLVTVVGFAAAYLLSSMA
jgi:ZIP family zinc transporter